jgi:hypothetical protein
MSSESLTSEQRVVCVDVFTIRSVREQLNAQNIHIVGHAAASLERSRQAILQLGASNIMTASIQPVLERRFRLVVRDTLQHYVGDRYTVKESAVCR